MTMLKWLAIIYGSHNDTINVSVNDKLTCWWYCQCKHDAAGVKAITHWPLDDSTSILSIWVAITHWPLDDSTSILSMWVAITHWPLDDSTCILSMWVAITHWPLNDSTCIMSIWVAMICRKCGIYKCKCKCTLIS